MTWVLGSGIPFFGYGALISDTRVVLSSGQQLDCLQKIYPVGSMLMAGFAGSVELGFQMIDDMRSFYTPAAGHMWLPKVAAWCWHRRAKRRFRLAPSSLRRLGCSLLLVGASPEGNGLYTHASCVRMRAPDFLPQRAQSMTWVSIGSGSQHRTARTYAEQNRKRFVMVDAQFEIHNGRGGVARFIASSVAEALRDEPLSSVSAVLQVGAVFVDEVSIWNQLSGSGSDTDVPTLATCWHGFLELVTGERDPSGAAA